MSVACLRLWVLRKNSVWFWLAPKIGAGRVFVQFRGSKRREDSRWGDSAGAGADVV